MVIYSTMESIIIPRPPALPLGLLNSSVNPLRESPLSPPPPPPKPSINHHNNNKDTPSEEINNTRKNLKNLSQITEKRSNQIIDVLKERRITQKMIEKKITRNESVKSKISQKSSTTGFRLIEHVNDNNNPQDDSGSIYSIYKQKIDSMFESDSNSSLHQQNNSQNNNNNNATTTNHNVVQAKIEKMFSDVAKDGDGIPSSNQMGIHAFSIDYLGSVPLQEKVTSLAGLQRPLKELYFSYRKVTSSKKILSGRLEISSHGLRVQYQGSAGDLEQINSFPTIAVWSAVKFVIQENNNSSSLMHGKRNSYAFLPLITDPDNMDKQTLFKNLEENEKKFILNEKHSPLFAVVMRKIGVQKQLECHGFVCQTSEDAIVIAATLYKALVNHMKNKEKKPKNLNGVTSCLSTASSTMLEPSGGNSLLMPIRPPRRKRSSAASSVCSDSNSLTNISDTQPLIPNNNNKPLKKSIKTKKAPKTPNETHQQEEEDLDAILPYEDPMELNENAEEIKPKTFSDKLNTYMSKEQKMIAAEIKQVVCDSNKGLKRVKSIRKRNEESNNCNKKENSGDIFTKVTIPRSGSFLNTSGLTRYKNKGSRNNESASGGSPVGFKEIFHELSIQEGLHSMDDILSVIIDPDGMSFNDLKPIYKEFLLKLSVTLTKDELYLKSKTIMRRQKKKTLKKLPISGGKKKKNKLVSGKFKRLKHIFQKNLNPNNAAKKLITEKSHQNLANKDIRPKNSKLLTESSISTSSYDTRPFRTKEELIGKKTGYKKKPQDEKNKNRRRDRTSTTSEESDFFSLKRQNKFNNNKYHHTNIASNQTRNSSSGYVSCSECSYDSDTCTCASADKCYCSLRQRTSFNRHESRRNSNNSNNEPEKSSLSYCDCDTDSCAESNKCYCQYGSHHRRNSSKKLHHHIHHSSKCSNDRHHNKHKKLCKNNSNTKSTRSLEYMANPSDVYYEKLRSKQRFGSERVSSSHYASSSNRGDGSLIRKRRNSHLGVSQNKYDILTIQDLQMGVVAENGKLSAMDYELLKLAQHRNISGIQQQESSSSMYHHHRNFCDNFKSHWSPQTNRNFGDSSKVHQSAITTGACTEALSVKKSAEIAALFADIKLSQTTDITHLTTELQNNNNNNNDHHRKKFNNTEINSSDSSSIQPKYSKPNKLISTNNPAIIVSPYAKSSFIPSHHYTRPNNLIKNKSKMYSAKNGLYTIQSQSDESRRSSLSESRKISNNTELLERYDISRRSLMSANMENTLGYLP